MDKVQIGYITGSYKVDGHFKVTSTTSFPLSRFKKGLTVIAKNNDIETEFTISNSAINGEQVILGVNEITSKEEADELKGYQLFAEKDNKLLGKNEFYFSDLEGCKVINQDNINIGVVIKVEEYPAQLTLRVKRDGKNDVLIPYVKSFIKNVDIDAKIIKVETIGGMLWK